MLRQKLPWTFNKKSELKKAYAIKYILRFVASSWCIAALIEAALCITRADDQKLEILCFTHAGFVHLRSPIVLQLEKNFYEIAEKTFFNSFYWF